MPLSRRFGRVALVLVASAFAASSLEAQRAHRDDLPAPEVRKLELIGVSKAVDKAEIEQSIYTTATTCRTAVLFLFCKVGHYRGFESRHYLNRQELQRDVLRIRVLYYRHGYRETEVDTTVSRLNEKQVAVRFTIREGPPTLVTDVSVVHDSTLIPARRLRRLTLLQTGGPMDLFQLDSMRVGFTNEMWERGYADALVDTSSIVDPVARTAQVQLRVVPNHLTHVGQIVISGTNQVSNQTVLNSLSFRPGDVYKRSTVLESQRNLYESNLFKLATLQVPESFDSVKTVNVLLREAQLHEARISAGFNTVDYLQSEGRYTAYNLFGGARRLDLTATVGNLFAGSLNGAGIFHRTILDPTITGDSTDFLNPTWQASVQLQQPAWLRRPRNSLAIGGFAQRRSVPAVVIDRGYGGNLTFTRSLGLRAPASLNYRFEVTRVEAGDAYFCVNFGVCDTTTIGTLRSHQRLSPALLTAQVDRTDQPLSPTRGYTARAELEHASRATVSDYSYNRAYADGAMYMRFGPRRAVLATHLRVGFVRPFAGLTGEAVLHPRKRFYAGGSQSVRGYGENQLGPRILTIPHGYLINAVTAAGTPCDANSDAIRLCDPNTVRDSTGTSPQPVGDDKFTPRPLGGTSIVEGSVEYRFPLPFMTNLGGAVFVDGAAVGERVFDPLGGLTTLRDLVRGTGAITPGFGIRYYSAVGPIRVDVGINPSRAEDLAVVTELVKNGKREIVPLDIPKRYSPTGTSTGIGALLNRLTLHLSIGQAY
ncbi:MAG: surface antigen [Gemmatimonadetes bacterium]|nr:surface antigen [Gemmatimonadota bacterium]